MPKSDLNIAILGSSLRISADADPDYLNTLLQKYEQFVAEVKRGTQLEDPLKIAILSGFLLCDEVEKTRSEKTKPGDTNQSGSIKDREAEQLTLGLISMLDKTLDG